MVKNVSGYIAAQTGYTSNITDYRIPNTNIVLGGKIENNKGFYVQAEVEEGTSFSEKVVFGKKWSLHNNLGITASLGEQYTRSNRTNSYYDRIYCSYDNSQDKGPTWKSNDTRGYGQVAFTYNNSNVETGGGIRAGVKSSKLPSLDNVTLAPIGTTKGTEFAGGATKSFAEGFGYLSFNLGKGCKATIEAAPSQKLIRFSVDI